MNSVHNWAEVWNVTRARVSMRRVTERFGKSHHGLVFSSFGAGVNADRNLNTIRPRTCAAECVHCSGDDDRCGG